MSDATGTPSATTALDGAPVELDISVDMVKRGALVAPVFIAVCGVIWGGDGAWSAAFGLGIVFANFLLAAALISGAARISLGLMMGATLFGYLIRLGLIFLAVWLVRDAAWISFPALGTTIIVSHLGLLVWEMKYVAISLAHSGPESTRSPATPATVPTDTHD